MKPVDVNTEPFDEASLTVMARKACGRADLRLDGWQVETLSGGFEMGSGVQRLSGVGEAAGERVPWSVVLKTIRCRPGSSSDPQGSHFWGRESHYYQSGLLEDLPAGLRAPRCYAVVEQPDHCQLFLEDLQKTCRATEPAQGWSLEEYRTAARCLGLFNGAYLAGRPLPAGDCIPRNWFQAYMEEAALSIGLFSRSTDHPYVRRSLGDIPAPLILQAWEQRREVLDLLERLPQVFCHNDAFLRNLFTESAGGETRLVAVDWSYAGPGALGTELAPLVSAGIGLGTSRFSEGLLIAQAALEGYLKGLGEAGWRGNPDLVRLGFSAGCFWRYPIAALIGEYVEWVVNEAYYPIIEQMNGKPVEQVADGVGEWMSWSLPYYEETWRLKKALDL